MLTKSRFLWALCLVFLTSSITAHAAPHRTFTLILDFSTCVMDPTNTNIITCQEFDAAGRPAGQIKVTFSNLVSAHGTFMTWHESWDYTLDGGPPALQISGAFQHAIEVA